MIIYNLKSMVRDVEIATYQKSCVSKVGILTADLVCNQFMHIVFQISLHIDHYEDCII